MYVNSIRSTKHIGKNFKVTVAADGKKKAYAVNSGTVSDILKKAGVKVGEYDILNHDNLVLDIKALERIEEVYA